MSCHLREQWRLRSAFACAHIARLRFLFPSVVGDVRNQGRVALPVTFHEFRKDDVARLVNPDLQRWINRSEGREGRVALIGAQPQ